MAKKIKQPDAEKIGTSTDGRVNNGGSTPTPRDESRAKEVFDLACLGQTYACACLTLKIEGMLDRDTFRKLYKPELDAGAVFFQERLRGKLSNAALNDTIVNSELIEKALKWGPNGIMHLQRAKLRAEIAAIKAAETSGGKTVETAGTELLLAIKVTEVKMDGIIEEKD